MGYEAGSGVPEGITHDAMTFGSAARGQGGVAIERGGWEGRDATSLPAGPCEGPEAWGGSGLETIGAEAVEAQKDDGALGRHADDDEEQEQKAGHVR